MWISYFVNLDLICAAFYLLNEMFISYFSIHDPLHRFTNYVKLLTNCEMLIFWAFSETKVQKIRHGCLSNWLFISLHGTSDFFPESSMHFVTNWIPSYSQQVCVNI